MAHFMLSPATLLSSFAIDPFRSCWTTWAVSTLEHVGPCSLFAELSPKAFHIPRPAYGFFNSPRGRFWLAGSLYNDGPPGAQCPRTSGLWSGESWCGCSCISSTLNGVLGLPLWTPPCWALMCDWGTPHTRLCSYMHTQTRVM